MDKKINSKSRKGEFRQGKIIKVVLRYLQVQPTINTRILYHIADFPRVSCHQTLRILTQRGILKKVSRVGRLEDYALVQK